MASDDKRIKYSDSPFAPDWARAPEKRGDVITSFGKPIPEAEDNPHLDFGNQENSASKAKNDEAADQPFKPTVEQIEEILWQDANDDIGVYCIMDGYWADGLYGRLLTSDDISWAHMFQGDVATRNIQQAPFIIALKRGHKLTKWLVEEGWGQGWGIYFTASTHKAHLLYGNPRINDKRFLPSNEEQLKLGNLTKKLEDPLWKMRRHFRQFSDVYLESENKILDFRYYDPNVFRIYIMSSNKKQLSKLYGPVTLFYAEGYNEIENLNWPELIYHFPNITNPAVKDAPFQAYYLHLKTEAITSVVHSYAEHILTEQRGAIITTINSQQVEYFEQDLLQRHAAKVANYLYIIFNPIIGKKDFDWFEFVLTNFETARKADYHSEIDLTNFTICSLCFGSQMYQSKHMAEHINSRNTHLCKDEVLEQWADRAVAKWGNNE